MTGPVIFAKIGWMKYYLGVRDDDPGPIGGGKHNAENPGGERFNFSPHEDGEIRGFVHTGKESPGKLDGLNLKRIEPTVNPNANSLDGVLVVFLAIVPEEHRRRLGKGPRVVGWYKNATVYDSAQHRGQPEAYYNLKTRNGAWSRIHWENRTRPFDLSGKGGMVQTDIRYTYKEDGSLDRTPWMDKVLTYIQEYNHTENAKASRQGSSKELEDDLDLYQRTPGLRSAIEEYAVDQAKRYYKELGYQIEYRGKPYDLLCKKDREQLFVEVKGTVQSGSTVLLTPNEKDQEFLKNGGKAELFVVCEIQFQNHDPATLAGGKIDIYSEWKPSEHGTAPFQYRCDLDRSKLTNTFAVLEKPAGE